MDRKISHSELMTLRRKLTMREAHARQVSFHRIEIRRLRDPNTPRQNHAFIESKRALAEIDLIERELVEILGPGILARYPGGEFLDYVIRSNTIIRKTINKMVQQNNPTELPVGNQKENLNG